MSERRSIISPVALNQGCELAKLDNLTFIRYSHVLHRLSGDGAAHHYGDPRAVLVLEPYRAGTRLDLAEVQTFQRDRP